MEILHSIGILVIFLLNFAISWFNAWAAGKAWPERRELRLPARLVLWSTVLMSIAGFTWCYLLLAGLLLHQFHDSWSWLSWATDERIGQLQSLGYVIIIPVVIVTGLVLTVDAWAAFWRRRALGNAAVAGWDSIATVYNTVEAIRCLPGAFENIGELFSSDDKEGWEDWVGMIVLIILVLVLGSGTLTTNGIVKRSARSHSRQLVNKHNSRLQS